MKRSHLIALALLSTVVIPAHGIDTSLSAGFAGTNKANGNIFTITAKSQAVSINSFDINMDGATTPQPAPVEIYFLPSTDPGFLSNNSPYTKIFMDNVTGKGKGNTTVLPDLTTPVVIPAGSTYSFYITVASLSFGTNIWYNTGVAVGDVVASDQHISIGEGYALGYPFLGYTPKRRWNGNVHYSVFSQTESPTGKPTMTPTHVPTKSSQPTSKPTTNIPTNQPTLDPTSLSPTGHPSPVPTTSVPTESPMTMKPTSSRPSPTGTLEPTLTSHPTTSLAPTKSNPFIPSTSIPTTRRPSSSSAKFGVNHWHYFAFLFVAAAGQIIFF